MSDPKVLDAPERIYLQAGELTEDTPFSDLAEVTWCRDEVSDADVAYVRADLFDRVLRERARSDARYGPARERGYTPHDWLAALTEETGEVARAISKAESRERVIEELAQVAGVALAAIEALEADSHEQGP